MRLRRTESIVTLRPRVSESLSSTASLSGEIGRSGTAAAAAPIMTISSSNLGKHPLRLAIHSLTIAKACRARDALSHRDQLRHIHYCIPILSGRRTDERPLLPGALCKVSIRTLLIPEHLC